MLIVKNARRRLEDLRSLGLTCWTPAIKKSSSKVIFPYGAFVFVEHPSLGDDEVLLTLQENGFRAQMREDGSPYVLSQEERDRVRNDVEEQEDPLFSTGTEVRITQGLFKGCGGKVVEVLENRFKVHLELQSSSFTVILPLEHMERW